MIVLRRLDDQRVTSEHHVILRDLYLETVDWAAQSQGDVSVAGVIAGLTDPQSIWRAIFDDEVLTGLIGATRINWIDKSCEPVIAIIPEQRHKALGRTVGEATRTFFVEKFGMRRVQVVVLEGAPSQGLLEHLGFNLEGTLRALRWKDGRYVNGLLYAWVKE